MGSVDGRGDGRNIGISPRGYDCQSFCIDTCDRQGFESEARRRSLALRSKGWVRTVSRVSKPLRDHKYFYGSDISLFDAVQEDEYLGQYGHWRLLMEILI